MISFLHYYNIVATKSVYKEKQNKEKNITGGSWKIILTISLLEIKLLINIIAIISILRAQQ